MNVSLNGNYTKYPFITNGVKGESENYNVSMTLGLNNTVENKYSWNVGFTPSRLYSINKSNDQDNAWWQTTVDVDGQVNLTKRLILGSDLEYFWNESIPTPEVTGISSGSTDNSFDRFYWNAFLAYNFLKKENLELRFAVNDILNENNGYNRSSSGFSINERLYLTIKRYFQVGLTWRFRTGPMAGNDASNGGTKSPRKF